MNFFVKLILSCFFIFQSGHLHCEADTGAVTLMTNYSVLSPVITDDCRYLLESFANVSANFTFCAITSARPITLCQDCVGSYVYSLNVHEDILKLIDRAGELCKQKLLNLDRLQIVEGGFGFIYGLWKRAKCDACYQMDEGDLPKKLKKELKEILKLQNETDVCIQNHVNDTGDGSKAIDPKVCYECKQLYLKLNSYYNKWEASTPICMDIIDMMNTTRKVWSVDLGCCLDRKTPEYLFLASSGVVSVLPVIFYMLACKFAGTQEHQVVLLRNRCSIPYPGYVPPTPGLPETEDDIPSTSSSNYNLTKNIRM